MTMAAIERSYVGVADRWGECEHCPSGVLAAVGRKYVCRAHIGVAVDEFMASHPDVEIVVVEFLMAPPTTGMGPHRRGWEVRNGASE
jgi:hypothetical protein